MRVFYERMTVTASEPTVETDTVAPLQQSKIPRLYSVIRVEPRDHDLYVPWDERSCLFLKEM